MISSSTRVERTFRWAIERLRQIPSKPAVQPTLFSRLREASDELHALAMKFHAEYERECEEVQAEVFSLNCNTSTQVI
jgi:hypothetical protein